MACDEFMRRLGAQDEIKEEVMNTLDDADSIFTTAVAHGCEPFWHEGIIGPAWHCGCKNLEHAHDQQCSAITKGVGHTHKERIEPKP